MQWKSQALLKIFGRAIIMKILKIKLSRTKKIDKWIRLSILNGRYSFKYGYKVLTQMDLTIIDGRLAEI